ncbi:MAG: lysylphosphatidylglycerol synthase domain-containing protein [Bacteroidales bacterium]
MLPKLLFSPDPLYHITKIKLFLPTGDSFKNLKVAILKVTRTHSTILKILFAGIALGYMVFRLVGFDHWDEALPRAAEAFSGSRSLMILGAFVLIYLNFSSEAVKWQRLVNRIEPTGYPKALAGVLTSLAMAVTTPGRIGDFITRGMILEPGNRFAASGHTFLCILAQMVMTVALGLLGAAVYLPANWDFLQGVSHNLNAPVLIAGIAGLALIILFFILDQLTGILQKIRWLKKINPFLAAMEGISVRDKSFLLVVSTFKYLTYIGQFYLLLIFFGVSLEFWEGMAAISLIYMIMHFLLVPTIGDLGVRGSLAILILEPFTTDVPAIVFATFAVWIINIMIPSLIGLLLLKRIRFETVTGGPVAGGS